MSEQIDDFEDYVEEHGFGEYADVLSDYEEVIKERMETKNVDAKTTLAGALYNAKKDEMSQYDVAVFSGVTEVSIRNARDAMGLDNDRDLNELMQVVPYTQAPLLEDYISDNIAEPPEAVAAVIHSQVLGKPIEDTAEYFGVDEDEVERASSWLEQNRDDEELSFEAVRRHLDKVRQDPENFEQLLEQS